MVETHAFFDTIIMLDVVVWLTHRFIDGCAGVETSKERLRVRERCRRSWSITPLFDSNFDSFIV